MARIRTIKPEFMSSPSVGRLSRDARLFFLQLLTQVDDVGRAYWIPKQLNGILFPLDDDVTSEDIQHWGEECGISDMLTFYSVDGTDYIEITNFLKHQRINRPTTTVLPSPNDGSVRTHGGLSEDSPPERKGKEVEVEGKGKEANGATSVTPADESIEPELIEDGEPEKVEPVSETPEVLDDAAEVILHMNTVCGKHYKLDSKQNCGYVKSRMREDKATLEELRLVADFKAFEWKGTDSEKWLRPETIYRASHWENYLQEAEAWNARGRVPLKPNGVSRETPQQALARLEAHDVQHGAAH